MCIFFESQMAITVHEITFMKYVIKVFLKNHKLYFLQEVKWRRCDMMKFFINICIFSQLYHTFILTIHTRVMGWINVHYTYLRTLIVFYFFKNSRFLKFYSKLYLNKHVKYMFPISKLKILCDFWFYLCLFYH